MKLVSLSYIEPIDEVMAEKINGGLALPTEPFDGDGFDVPDLLGSTDPQIPDPIPDCAVVLCEANTVCICK